MNNSYARIADTSLMAVPSNIRVSILHDLNKIGTLREAIAFMERFRDATQRVLDDLELEQADHAISTSESHFEAAEWFLDNVPLDANWRGDAYCLLRERIRRP